MCFPLSLAKVCQSAKQRTRPRQQQRQHRQQRQRQQRRRQPTSLLGLRRNSFFFSFSEEKLNRLSFDLKSAANKKNSIPPLIKRFSKQEASLRLPMKFIENRDIASLSLFSSSLSDSLLMARTYTHTLSLSLSPFLSLMLINTHKCISEAKSFQASKPKVNAKHN